MLQDEQASQFLSHQAVSERLHASMQQWIVGLFSAATPEHIAALVKYQMHVGEVHARVGISVSMVYRGARLLRGKILPVLGKKINNRDEFFQAVAYVSESFDHALEAMSSAYGLSRELGARAEESFRLFSVSQNLLVEKERQRAALLDWENQFVYLLASGGRFDILPKIFHSDFGLWFVHKGESIFADAPEMSHIYVLINKIDGMLSVNGGGDNVSSSQETSLTLLKQIQEGTSHLKYLLNTMFERIFELEAGRDALTHLLNRRFLPVVLGREIVIARRTGKPFAVLMIDIDLFKKVNDTYGHGAGDAVLQQIAGILLNCIRVSDYAFRYGGEEFLLVTGEVTEKDVVVIAEKIRRHISEEELPLPSGQLIKATISVGIAIYDGHPDYEKVIKEADQALYAAKSGGRNQCVVYTPTLA